MKLVYLQILKKSISEWVEIFKFNIKYLFNKFKEDLLLLRSDLDANVSSTNAKIKTIHSRISAKLNKLVAGLNISINGNIISATGGETYTAGQNIDISDNSISTKGYRYDESVSSFAEGSSTSASGAYSHAEGNGTTALGYGSHAEGVNTTASETSSHAEGIATQATHEAEHAQGKYNKSNSVEIPSPIEYVDMGTSVLWAKWNLGATSETEYGDYYAWGETEPKSSYTWANYKWGDPNNGGITKYNSTDGKTELDPEDDAAHVNLGGGWRMPTKDEMQELIDNCTYSWQTDYQGSGVNGGLFTAQNGNTLFIPAAGSILGTSMDTGFGICQSSNLESENLYSYNLTIYCDSSEEILGFERRAGQPIRPVISRSDIPGPINTIHSTGIGTSNNDRKNAFEIMDNGDVYVKGIGGYDGTNPSSSLTLQAIINGLLSNT